MGVFVLFCDIPQRDFIVVATSDEEDAILVLRDTRGKYLSLMTRPCVVHHKLVIELPNNTLACTTHDTAIEDLDLTDIAMADLELLHKLTRC